MKAFETPIGGGDSAGEQNGIAGVDCSGIRYLFAENSAAIVAANAVLRQAYHCPWGKKIRSDTI